MTGNIYDFNRKAPQDEMYQEYVDRVHDAMQKNSVGQITFASGLLDVLKNRVWEHARKGAMSVFEPVSFEEFVKLPYPQGLDSDFDTVEKFIQLSTVEKTRNEALALWCQLTKRPAGAPAGNQNAAKSSSPDETIVDNIHDCSEERPTGTSRAAGMRRLQKAAEEGDEQAQAYLEDVLDGKMSIHAACIAMGWRKKMRAVPADEAGPSGIDKEVKRDAAGNMARWLAENSKAEQWDWIKGTLYTAGAKLIADAFVNEIGAGSATMDKAGWR